MKRKLLSLFLTVALLVTMIPGFSITSSAAEVKDTLNREFTGITGPSYNTWSEKTSNSDAVYAGNSAGGNSSIQLRSSGSSGIVTTTSGGNIKSISVVWNSNTTTSSDRVLDIYGNNESYSGASDLYGNNKGTKIGSIKYGTSTEWTLTGETDYAYIGLRSNNGAMYLTSITITWDVGQGSTGGDTPTPTHSHTYSYQSNEDGTHTKTCTNEDGLGGDEEAVIEDCTFGTGEVTTPATCGGEGVKTFTCEHCGYTKTEVINPTEEHVDVDPKDGICDICEAEMPAAPYIAKGDKVAFLSKNASKELASITASGTRYGTGQDYSTNHSAAMWFDVVEGSTSGTFAFKNGNEYLYWTSNNSLATNGTKSANTSWNVSFDEDGNAIITNAADSTRQIWWNNQSPRFACYANQKASTTMYSIQLYIIHQTVSDHVHSYSYHSNEDGTHTKTCANEDGKCDAVEVTENCTFGDGDIKTASTCSAEGVKTYTCTLCGYAKEEAIPKTEHTDANNDHICDACALHFDTPSAIVRAAYDLAVNNALPGTFTLEGTITNIQTPYDSGYKNITVDIEVSDVDAPNTIRCYRLKASDNVTDDMVAGLKGGDVITVSGKLKNYNGIIEFDANCTLDSIKADHVHDYQWDGNEGSNGKHTEACVSQEGTCDDPIREVDCTWNAGVITTPATCSAAGEKTYTCTICGATKTETIPVTAHKDLNGDGICDDCNTKYTGIAIGNQVIISCKPEGAAAKVLSSFSDTSTVYGIGSEDASKAKVFTIVAGALAGTFAFESDGAYLSWASGNSLETKTTIDANSSWNVSFDQYGNATILNAADTARQIWWNNSKNALRFACYTGKTIETSGYAATQIDVVFPAPVEPAIVERNMTLGASLAFSIWATLDKTEYPNAVLTATLNNYTTTFAFGEAETDGRFKFTYTDVVPAEVADEITVKILAEEGGDELASQTFTLYEYLLQVKEADSKYEGLINGLLGYCAEAQIANGKTPIEVPGDAAAPENPADNTAIKDAVFTGVPASAAAAAEINLEMSGYFKSATALNKNVTYLRFEYVGSAAYFTIKKGDADEVAVTLKNGKFIETEGLMPTEFGTDITVTAYDSQNGVISSVVYSVNTYCKRMNTNETNAYSLNLYNYGLTAAAFVK